VVWSLVVCVVVFSVVEEVCCWLTGTVLLRVVDITGRRKKERKETKKQRSKEEWAGNWK